MLAVGKSVAFGEQDVSVLCDEHGAGHQVPINEWREEAIHLGLDRYRIRRIHSRRVWS